MTEAITKSMHKDIQNVMATQTMGREKATSSSRRQSTPFICLHTKKKICLARATCHVQTKKLPRRPQSCVPPGSHTFWSRVLNKLPQIPVLLYRIACTMHCDMYGMHRYACHMHRDRCHVTCIECITIHCDMYRDMTCLRPMSRRCGARKAHLTTRKGSSDNKEMLILQQGDAALEILILQSKCSCSTCHVTCVAIHVT